MEIYLVGGCVRDKLLGIEPKDLDYVVVGGTPEYFIKKGYQQVGADFPVFLHPETNDEYALARKERKVGEGYHGFECDFDETVTLEEDLLRRDLTINAMAMNPEGNIIDPFLGKRDLKNKELKHVSQHFREDPLRVLRVARFLARYKEFGFSIHKETMNLMKEMVDSGELNHLTPERVKLETDKALLENNPEEYFLALRECGALKVIFPEIDSLFGVPQPEQHHPEIDSGVHTMLVLQQAKKLTDNYDNKEHKLILLWSALLHDLGKAITPKEELPRHIGHEKAGVPIINSLADRIKLSSKERAMAKATSRHHLNVHTVFDIKAPNIYEKLIKSIDAIRNPVNLKILIDACEADAKGRTGLENRDYPQKRFLLSILDNIKKINQGEIAKKVMSDNNIPKSEKPLVISENIKSRHIQCVSTTRSFFKDRDKYLDFYEKAINSQIESFSRSDIGIIKCIGREGFIKDEILLKLPDAANNISKFSHFSELLENNNYSNLTQNEKDALKGGDIGKRIAEKQKIILNDFLNSFSIQNKSKIQR